MFYCLYTSVRERTPIAAAAKDRTKANIEQAMRNKNYGEKKITQQ